MNVSDFHSGLEFLSGERRWRCTDVGSRVVVAIRIDEVTIGSLDLVTGTRSERTIHWAQAQREGWFRGPPYPVVEVVFDEDALDTCEPAP